MKSEVKGFPPPSGKYGGGLRYKDKNNKDKRNNYDF